MMARWTAASFGAGAVIEEHADRRACVADAEFVTNVVQIGMHEATLLDFEVPRNFGLKQTTADAAGIGGIFRGSRTIPFMLDLVRDMRELCPDALLMHCTNPMSILTWSVYDTFHGNASFRRVPRCTVHRATWPAVSAWSCTDCRMIVRVSTT